LSAANYADGKARLIDLKATIEEHIISAFETDAGHFFLAMSETGIVITKNNNLFYWEQFD